MKVTTLDLSLERKVLTASITDTNFLAKTRRLFDPSLMESDYARHVAKWVLAYYDRTEKAPGRDIQHIYEIERHNLANEPLTELVSQFLASLSREFESDGKINTDYSVNLAQDYFRTRKLHKLKETLEAAIAKKDLDAAEQFVANYHRPELPTTAGIRLFSDAAVADCYKEEDTAPLFRLPGLMDDLMGPICRGDFFAIAAPFKTGKSFWLDFVAKAAALQGCKVVYYPMEMSNAQTVRRAWRGLEGAPLSGKARDIEVPYFDEWGNIAKTSVNREGMIGNTYNVERSQRSLRMLARGGDVLYRAKPRGTFSPKDLRADLDMLAHYEGFVPDVVMLDGADNMRCDNPRLEKRHQLDDIWGDLSAVRMERNIAICTVSHVKREGKKSGKSDSADLSEAGSKANHVTHLMMLNQTNEQREAGFMLLNCGDARDHATRSEPLVVLECRDIGRVCVDMRWGNDCFFGRDKR